MKTRALFVVVWMIVLSFLIALPADAQGPKPSRDQRVQDELDKCLEGGPYPYGPPSCTFDSEGNLIGRDVPGEESSSPFGGFLLFALLWAAIPMVAGASIASSREQSVGLALLLTFFLGWLGLIIVFLMQKPEVVETVREHVSRLETPDVADQIRKLGKLRDEGLLTDDEFAAKKAQLLGTA